MQFGMRSSTNTVSGDINDDDDGDRKLKLLEAKRNVAMLEGQSTQSLDNQIWLHKQKRPYCVSKQRGISKFSNGNIA